MCGRIRCFIAVLKLYQLNLKFEVEVLCKHLSLEISVSSKIHEVKKCLINVHVLLGIEKEQYSQRCWKSQDFVWTSWSQRKIRFGIECMYMYYTRNSIRVSSTIKLSFLTKMTLFYSTCINCVLHCTSILVLVSVIAGTTSVSPPLALYVYEDIPTSLPAIGALIRIDPQVRCNNESTCMLQCQYHATIQYSVYYLLALLRTHCAHLPVEHV